MYLRYVEQCGISYTFVHTQTFDIVVEYLLLSLYLDSQY